MQKNRGRQGKEAGLTWEADTFSIPKLTGTYLIPQTWTPILLGRGGRNIDPLQQHNCWGPTHVSKQGGVVTELSLLYDTFPTTLNITW